MSDSEKICLIGKMIADFWEYNDEQTQKDGAMALVTAICTVADFEEAPHG